MVRGDYRALLVERPGPELRLRGVGPGTRLLEGVNDEGWLVASALDLDATCAARDLHFVLEGPLDTPGRLDLGGRRQVYEGCRPTGRWVTETMNLTLAGHC